MCSRRTVCIHQIHTKQNYATSGMDHLVVEQINFITGEWSLNEEDLKKKLEFFKVPNVNMEPIRPKLALKIFDEYENILKGMYLIRFNGRCDHGRTPTRPDLGPDPRLPLLTLSV